MIDCSHILNCIGSCRVTASFAIVRIALIAGVVVAIEPATVCGTQPADHSGFRIEVRATDCDGRPVPEARVAVRRLEPAAESPQEPWPKSSIVKWNDESRFWTDAAGVFRSDVLPAGAAYVVEVAADGFAPAVSRWLKSGGGVSTLPDVALRRLTSVAGRVVDRENRPVAEALVFQSGDGPERTETTTDAAGKFRIHGIPQGKAFLFVEKEDFWFTGRLIETSQPSHELVVARRNEANPERFEPLAPPVSAAAPRGESFEEEASTQSKNLGVVLEQTDKVLATGTDLEKTRQLGALAAIDPAAALERLKPAAFSHAANWSDAVYVVAAAVAQNSPLEAREILLLIDHPQDRARLSLVVLEQIPHAPMAVRRDMVDEILLALRGDMNPATKTWLTSRCAQVLREVDEPDRAHKLLFESIAALEKLPEDEGTRRAFGHLAIALAEIDAKAALEQAKRADASARFGLAKALARKDPAAAEQVVRGITFSTDGPSGAMHWHNIPRICYRMASVDLERARRIAERALGAHREFRRFVPGEDVRDEPNDAYSQSNVGPVHLKALTLAWMADAVRESQPDAARELFGEAVGLLRPLREAAMFDHSGFMHSPSLILVSLFPVAERVCPERVPELFWRAVASRLPADGSESSDHHAQDISLGAVAGMLARYDRTVARAVMEPVLQRQRLRSFGGVSACVWPASHGTSIDIDWIAAWGKTLSDEPLGTPVFNSTDSPRDRVQQIIDARLNASESAAKLAERAPGVTHPGTWPSVMSILWLDEFTDAPRRVGR